MGDLAVKYGYYGAEWEGPGRFGEAGESLTVAGRPGPFTLEAVLP